MNSEEWKSIKGYEGLYMVSNLGRVKSLCGFNGHEYVKREKILNPYKQKAGKNYHRSVVKLFKDGNRKDFKVHRLVADAFIPNPELKSNINHIDGNPLNNRVDNLEWCTQKENVIHAIDTDLSVRVIDTIDRETMVDFLNNGHTYDEIASLLGIAKGTVFNYISKFKIQKIYR